LNVGVKVLKGKYTGIRSKEVSQKDNANRVISADNKRGIYTTVKPKIIILRDVIQMKLLLFGHAFYRLSDSQNSAASFWYSMKGNKGINNEERPHTVYA